MKQIGCETCSWYKKNIDSFDSGECLLFKMPTYDWLVCDFGNRGGIALEGINVRKNNEAGFN